MIVGVGSDLSRIERIRRSIDKFGKDWLQEVFNKSELEKLPAGSKIYNIAAIGFALKEACSKAIGTGFAEGVNRRNFEVLTGNKTPTVRLIDAAQKRAVKLCRNSLDYRFQLSIITDEALVLATAILYVGDVPPEMLTSTISNCIPRLGVVPGLNEGQ